MATTNKLIQGYARAMFAVAEAEGDLERVEDELFRFGETVERQPDLREALTDPQLPADRKRSLLEDLLGDRATKSTVGLLEFVIEQGRAKDLPRIIEALVELAGESRHHSVAEVRTAVPLDDAHRKRLTEALSKATGKEIELKVLVDPSVIGGVLAKVGDEVFDGTVRRKLQLARQQLGRVR
jgi:F-type H+-transporting ATPase subunit delta